jgi:RND family efflux transporter MFP subunit
VRAGDVLVRLAPEDLQAALKEKEAGREGAMAEMVLAMQSLNRIEQLVSRRVASQEQLDKARSEVAARKARLDGLDAQVEVGQKALQDTQIIAPFDGIVSKVMVNQGTQVAPDAELLTLVDVADMEARVLISTQDVSRVAAGQFVELQIDGFENQVIRGEVARISPVVDEGSRAVAIHIRLPDDGRFKGGMFIHGSVLVRQAEDAIAVPVAALRRDQQEVYVLKLLDGVLVRQPVTILSQWEDEMAEVSGLAPGDMIVRSPLSELRPGLPVIVAQVG